MQREAVGLAPDDPYNWSNLGDSLREVPDAAAEQQQAYRRALELFEDLLAVNPRDAELLTNAAHCHARLGNDAQASQYMEQAALGAPADPYVFYYASLVHLEAGRTAAALKDIRRAVELNYPLDQLRNDPQFKALNSDPGFQALLGETAGSIDSG